MCAQAQFLSRKFLIDFMGCVVCALSVCLCRFAVRSCVCLFQFSKHRTKIYFLPLFQLLLGLCVRNFFFFHFRLPSLVFAVVANLFDCAKSRCAISPTFVLAMSTLYTVCIDNRHTHTLTACFSKTFSKRSTKRTRRTHRHTKL